MPVKAEERHSAATPNLASRQGRIVAVTSALGLALLIGAIVAYHEWPFTRAAVAQALQQQAGSEVQIKAFHQQYFPKPGCIAETVTFRRTSGQREQPYLTIQRLTIIGSYHGLLTHHISTIQAEGLHVMIPAQPASGSGSPPQFKVGYMSGGLTIGQIIADGSAVEFAPTPGRKQALIFRVPKLTLHDLAAGRPLAFQATVEIPYPAAEVDLTGDLAPWQPGRGGQTKLSGSYAVKSLDLGSFDGIAGMLTSNGNFDGSLQHVVVNGHVDTPGFTVSTSGHPVHVAGEFAAAVNGLNGDVNVDAARLHYGRTVILTAGSVSSLQDGQPKTATFELSSRRARVQELVWMFISQAQPPMTGPIVFRAKATLPPGKSSFLQRVKLEGDFGISDAQYPHPDTQKNIDVLSARARGRADKVEDANDKLGNNSYDPGRVLSNVKGHVRVSNAVANLRNVVFDVPGAQAKVCGTYNLHSERIDLHGVMHLESELSRTTTGVKSVLLRVFEPFLKKGKRHESVIAIRIGGTYEHPTYAIAPRVEK